MTLGGKKGVLSCSKDSSTQRCIFKERIPPFLVNLAFSQESLKFWGVPCKWFSLLKGLISHQVAIIGKCPPQYLCDGGGGESRLS